MFSVVALNASELVKFPQGTAAWSVDITPSGTRAAKEITARRVEIQQDAAKRRNIVTYSNGKVRETWNLGGASQVITEAPNGVVFFSNSGGLFNPPFTEEEFAWLGADNLVSPKPVTFRGKRCLHYFHETDIERDAKGKTISSLKKEAYIEADTLLPVALNDGRFLGVFTFSDPPAELVPPPRFAKLLKAYDKSKK